uniref:CHHC U11-48K-type domain-containing protein n=1 Tax=Macrostomum lignano TaxID=282301 RepID=A0A1I8FEJ0_9PLAT
KHKFKLQVKMSSEKVTCPFDSVHVVERHKLITHMSAAIKSYKGGSHTPMHCPLDYSHVVEAGKMNEHLMTCSQLALAVPLLSVNLGSDVVTGNLQLPDQPSSINDLNGTLLRSRRGPAFANDYYYADDLSTADYADTASAYSKGRAASEVTSNYGYLPAGGGLGRAPRSRTLPRRWRRRPVSASFDDGCSGSLGGDRQRLANTDRATWSRAVFVSIIPVQHSVAYSGNLRIAELL